MWLTSRYSHFTPEEKNPQYPLNSGPRACQEAMEKSFLSLSEIGLRYLGRLPRSLVTMLTELSRLLSHCSDHKKKNYIVQTNKMYLFWINILIFNFWCLLHVSNPTVHLHEDGYIFRYGILCFTCTSISSLMAGRVCSNTRRRNKKLKIIILI
jgi:hypothetical protein